jgi:type III secretory pathway component EscT
VSAPVVACCLLRPALLGLCARASYLADTYKSKVPLTELVAELSELLIANHGATRK